MKSVMNLDQRVTADVIKSCCSDTACGFKPIIEPMNTARFNKAYHAVSLKMSGKADVLDVSQLDHALRHVFGR